MQNNNIATKLQNKAVFSLGEVFVTVGAQLALRDAKQTPFEFLTRHLIGDWGVIGKEDWEENELSLVEGFRLLSAYKTALDEKIWIITEADRSLTTILLPNEY